MNDMELYRLLQINGGTFPTGGFSQSWGLETYVAEGKVNDAESFSRFLETYMIACMGKCEGPIICRAHELAGSDNMPKEEKNAEIINLEQLSNASKVTRESREGALRMGKAFMRIISEIVDHPGFADFADALKTTEISYPVSYGFACGLMKIPVGEALAAYAFSTANTLVQSAVKLVPLGNTEAQKVLAASDKVLEKAVELSMGTELSDITNFCPGIDIAGIRHETLPVRLYMS